MRRRRNNSTEIIYSLFFQVYPLFLWGESRRVLATLFQLVWLSSLGTWLARLATSSRKRLVTGPLLEKKGNHSRKRKRRRMIEDLKGDKDVVLVSPLFVPIDLSPNNEKILTYRIDISPNNEEVLQLSPNERCEKREVLLGIPPRAFSRRSSPAPPSRHKLRRHIDGWRDRWKAKLSFTREREGLFSTPPERRHAPCHLSKRAPPPFFSKPLEKKYPSPKAATSRITYTS